MAMHRTPPSPPPSTPVGLRRGACGFGGEWGGGGEGKRTPGVELLKVGERLV